MRTIFVFVAFMLVTNIFSQEVDGNNFSLGPKIGLNISGNSLESSATRIGWQAGVTSTYSINEMSGVGIDLFYSGQGYKSGDTDVQLVYAQLPVVYKYFFNKLGNRFRPRVELGVSPAILLDSKGDKADFNSSVNSYDFSVVGGLGFNYRLNTKFWLNVDLRTQWGMVNVFRDVDSKNRVYILNAGIAMGI